MIEAPAANKNWHVYAGRREHLFVAAPGSLDKSAAAFHLSKPVDNNPFHVYN
ncbi:hypothetical protein [Peribacillus cavernae]|uniref:hypothetical protein n=1 Tax=Peribacillus cavernae TaxID=1674310 RepID=UPI00278B05E8|nr:hypothetical protein [Peribacillus cavernae]MDQ0220588.1 hypothetical protein [Peribacillus cavernae]